MRKELPTRTLGTCQSRYPVKTSLRNDSKSRWSQRGDESSVFHQQTHPARTAEQRSKQREEKQPGVFRRKGDHGRQRKCNRFSFP